MSDEEDNLLSDCEDDCVFNGFDSVETHVPVFTVSGSVSVIVI